MTDDRDRPTPSIGDQLDHIRWDYAPLKREKRFFLSSLSSFFGAFPWEGAAQMMPLPPRPKASADGSGSHDPKSERGGSE